MLFLHPPASLHGLVNPLFRINTSSLGYLAPAIAVWLNLGIKPVVETESSRKSGITGSFQSILLIRDYFRLGVCAPCQGMHIIVLGHPQLCKTARRFCVLKLAIEPFVIPLPRLWDLCRLPRVRPT